MATVWTIFTFGKKGVFLKKKELFVVFFRFLRKEANVIFHFPELSICDGENANLPMYREGFPDGCSVNLRGCFACTWTTVDGILKHEKTFIEKHVAKLCGCFSIQSRFYRKIKHGYYPHDLVS